MRVTLTNAGDLPATGIVAFCNRSGEGGGLNGTGPGWGDLAGDGVDIAPHATLTLTVTEPMPARAYDYGTVWVGCDFGYDGVEDEGNPRSYDEAAVPGMRGDITGVVAAGDTGIAGARVVLVAPEADCPQLAEATTDATGAFTLKQVPVGDHQLYVFPPTGWHVVHDNPVSVRLIGAGPSKVGIEVAAGNAPAPALPAQPAGCVADTTPTTTTTPAAQGRVNPDLASTGASIVAPSVLGLLVLLAGIGTVVATRRRRQEH